MTEKSVHDLMFRHPYPTIRRRSEMATPPHSLDAEHDWRRNALGGGSHTKAKESSLFLGS
jgi:hypothetical protein